MRHPKKTGVGGCRQGKIEFARYSDLIDLFRAELLRATRFAYHCARLYLQLGTTVRPLPVEADITAQNKDSAFDPKQTFGRRGQLQI
jgi:hypothetical protein